MAPPQDKVRKKEDVKSIIAGLLVLAAAAASSVTGIEVRSRPELQEGTIYIEDSWRRMALYQGPVDNCKVVGREDKIRQVMSAMANLTWVEGIATPRVRILGRQEMREVLEACDRAHVRLMSNEIDGSSAGWDGWDRISPVSPSSSSTDNGVNSLFSMEFLRGLLIFPGTKWCGKGDIAEHYNDFGYHQETDKCCRNHDLCLEVTGEYLAPGQCKNGLCNPSPFTRAPCQCDLQLRSCLKSVKTSIANMIGRSFFNIAGMSCYKYEHPVKRCVEYVERPRSNLPTWILTLTKINDNPHGPRCRRYEYDFTKPKAWQFFETFFEETTNHRSQEPRSRKGRRKPMPLFQRILLDIVSKVLYPV